MLGRHRLLRNYPRLAVRYLRMRLLGYGLRLQPSNEIQPVADEPGLWCADGSDPIFDCVAGCFPLKAGWYRLSIELKDTEGGTRIDRLDPKLYFDCGDGMQESCSLRLNFIRLGEKRHVGVVLFPRNVHRLRFDPADIPCTFHAGHLALRRIGRIGAAWRMLHAALSSPAAVGAEPRALLIDAWRKLRGAGGPAAFAAWLYGVYTQGKWRGERSSYEDWLRFYDRSPQPALTHPKLLVSILLPVFNTSEGRLRRCLDSVLNQSYPHWELCVAADASTGSQARALLEEYIRRDPRIRVVWLKSSGHASTALNSALAMANGDYVAQLADNDELHSQALGTIVEALQRNPQWRLVYSDEDKVDDDGQRQDPYFKPDWNPDLLCGQNYVGHLCVYARALLNAVDGFREGLEGSQDWDLVLRCSERLKQEEIGHVPRVLYHRGMAGEPSTQGPGEKIDAREAGLHAVREHFSRCGVAAQVTPIDDLPGMFRVRYPLPDSLPFISIIIPTRDQISLLRQCVESILALTTYPHYEVIVVDNQSVEPESLAYFSSFAHHEKVHVRKHDKPFNYSSINNDAVEGCRGELVCLLNNDIEVITPDWLEELASHALRPHIGAVGAMLYYPNDTIQHAGVITGPDAGGMARHFYVGMPRGYLGQRARARLTQNMSAVTGACLMLRRAVYEQVGGLDTSLRVAFNDIDLCLRLRQHGYANVWTPFAELYHHESASRGLDNTPEKQARFAGEVTFMETRWGRQADLDPAYNPNLTFSGELFTLAFPPRQWWPVTTQPASGDGIGCALT
jgi:O-antigen biosynthesis protein